MLQGLFKMLLGADKEYVCLMHLHEEISETENKRNIEGVSGKKFSRHHHSNLL